MVRVKVMKGIMEDSDNGSVVSFDLLVSNYDDTSDDTDDPDNNSGGNGG